MSKDDPNKSNDLVYFFLFQSFFAGYPVDAGAHRHQHPQGLWPVEGEVRRQGDQSFLGEVLIKVKIINAT